MYWHKNNFLLHWLYPSFTWHKSRTEKKIYLTFDDGPIPEVTEWVLATLKPYQAQATFFCVGDNIRKYPQIYEQIKQAKHSLGNHTFNHLNGWKTPVEVYLDNVEKFRKVGGEEVLLFRPPYGKITRQQAAGIRKTHQIVMWDVLSGDFDQKLSPAACLDKSIKYTENGTIIIFHDSLKARKNLEYVLPSYLKHFDALGYTFEKL
ncbi:polysaccharide deacetylase family protein [Rhodocytophaga aerolata]|uniref:Polysaccharide deacetylase family protein n=1 Tax=Rhodocytophaga aerolata TaxID=455078 RepID=A0ABT8QZG4_9BACT|nr:polysaccharide deacetylase family protein [Rhodocytophaga aerolata]MDO1445235.1 polysaccharide deacetylase family protein [Rhodocytophaga aerolata]